MSCLCKRQTLATFGFSHIFHSCHYRRRAIYRYVSHVGVACRIGSVVVLAHFSCKDRLFVTYTQMFIQLFFAALSGYNI